MATPFSSIARTAFPSMAPLLDVVDRFQSPETPFPTQPSMEQGAGQVAQGAIPTGTPGVLYNVFSSAGFTPTAIYGILGNVQQESGFNPGAYNAGEGAGGLFQHRFDRLTGGQAFAQGLGLQWNDPRAQALWAVEEINRNPALKAKLNMAKTPEEAATIFDREFERSAGLHTAQRQKFARAWAGGTPMPYSIPNEMSQHPEGLLPQQTDLIDPSVRAGLEATIARIQGTDNPQSPAGRQPGRFRGSGIGTSAGQAQPVEAQGSAPGDTFDPALGGGLIARSQQRRVQRKGKQTSMPRVQIPGRT
jgi:hypothetical protein